MPQPVPYEVQEAIKAALNVRYPALATLQKSVSAERGRDGKITGTVTYYSASSSSTAVFEYELFGRDGRPRLYVTRDWND